MSKTKQKYFEGLYEAAVNKLQRKLNQAEHFYITEKTTAYFNRNHPVPEIPESLQGEFHKKFNKQSEK